MGRWGTKSESRGPGESEGGARAKGGTAPGGPRHHPSEGETRKLAERRRKPTPERGKRRPKALPLSYPPWTPPWGLSSTCASRALSRERHPRSGSTGSVHGLARPVARQLPRPGVGARLSRPARP